MLRSSFNDGQSDEDEQNDESRPVEKSRAAFGYAPKFS
jgi:hypothetical protein